MKVKIFFNFRLKKYYCTVFSIIITKQPRIYFPCFIFPTRRRAFIFHCSPATFSGRLHGAAAKEVKPCDYGVPIVPSHPSVKICVNLSCSSVLRISPLRAKSRRQFYSIPRNLIVSPHFQLPMTRSMASVGRRCIGATLPEPLLLTSAMCSSVIEVMRSGRPTLKTRTLICYLSSFPRPSKLVKMKFLLRLAMQF